MRSAMQTKSALAHLVVGPRLYIPGGINRQGLVKNVKGTCKHYFSIFPALSISKSIISL